MPSESSRQREDDAALSVVTETVRQRFLALLDNIETLGKAAREPLVQKFFEENPGIISGPDYINPNAVISKLQISTSFVSDFAYIQPTSGAHYVHLVEIEDPTKNIFTRQDQFTEAFNHAIQQVHDWIATLQRDNDYLEQVLDDAQSQFGQAESYSLVVRGQLYFGRRAEINNPIRRDRWQQRVRAESTFIKIRTYDGLMERSNPAFSQISREYGDPHCYSYSERKFHQKIK